MLIELRAHLSQCGQLDIEYFPSFSKMVHSEANDECLSTNDERMTKSEIRTRGSGNHDFLSDFVIMASFVIGASSFVIYSALGYEPSTFTKVHVSLNSRNAVATLRSR